MKTSGAAAQTPPTKTAHFTVRLRSDGEGSVRDPAETDITVLSWSVLFKPQAEHGQVPDQALAITPAGVMLGKNNLQFTPVDD
jgi:hypothetical protein